MELKRRVIKNFFLFLAASLFSRAVQFFSRIALAWLLLPSEFGLFAIGFFFVSALEVFRSSGFEHALIYTKKDATKAANTVFVIQMGLSLALFAILFLFSGFIGAFFGKNPFEALEIGKIVQALSFLLIINSIGAVHAALLEKRMEFKKRVLPEIISSITYFFVAIALAASGFGVWSLVIATLTAGIIYNVLMLFVSPLKISFKLDRDSWKDLFDYAKYSLQASLLVFLAVNLDIAVIGKLLTAEMLGFYSMAMTIVVMLPAQFTFAIGKVSFPAYSIIIDEKAKVVDAFEKALRYALLFFLPLLSGIILLSPMFVSVVLGQKWENPELIAAMQVLSIAALARVLGSVASPVISAAGKPKIFAVCSLAQLLLLAIFIIPLTSAFGIVGTSAIVSATAVAVTFAYLFFVFKSFKIRKKRIAKSAAITVASTIAMAGVIALLGLVLGEKSLLNFLVICSAAALAFFLPEAFFDKALFPELWQDLFPRKE